MATVSVRANERGDLTPISGPSESNHSDDGIYMFQLNPDIRERLCPQRPWRDEVGYRYTIERFAMSQSIGIQVIIKGHHHHHQSTCSHVNAWRKQQLNDLQFRVETKRPTVVLRSRRAEWFAAIVVSRSTRPIQALAGQRPSKRGERKLKHDRMSRAQDARVQEEDRTGQEIRCDALGIHCNLFFLSTSLD